MALCTSLEFLHSNHEFVESSIVMLKHVWVPVKKTVLLQHTKHYGKFHVGVMVRCPQKFGQVVNNNPSIVTRSYNFSCENKNSLSLPYHVSFVLNDFESNKHYLTACHSVFDIPLSFTLSLFVCVSGVVSVASVHVGSRLISGFGVLI